MASSSKAISTLATRASEWRVRTASLITKVLAVSLLVAAPVGVLNAPAAHAAACTYGSQSTTVSGISLTPSHGLDFYTDYGVTPKVDASFIGYQVSNTTGGALSDFWVKVSGFDATLKLASNNAEESYQLPTISNNDTQTAFFFLKSTVSSSLTAHAHTVSVYQGNPASSSSTLVYSCDYSFKKIIDVIQASASNTKSVSVSAGPYSIGDTITVTLQNDPGTLGSGTQSDDGSIIWLTPTAYSSFPIGSVKLVDVRFYAPSVRTTTAAVAAGCQMNYYHELLIKNAATCFPSSDVYAYFTFKVVAQGPNTTIAPMANLASGTPIKHTPLTTAVLDLSGVSTGVTLTFEKSETHTIGSDNVESITGTSAFGMDPAKYYYKLYYVETITSSSATVTNLDSIVDSPTAGSVMDTATAIIKSSGSWTVVHPSLISGKYVFQGPIGVSSANPINIWYTMYAPVNVTVPDVDTTTVTNTLSGYIGSTSLGSVTNTTKIYDPTQKSTETTQTIPPAAKFVRTDAATSIETMTAVLNGYGNDSPTAKVYFRYSTLEDSVTANTVDSVTASFVGTTRNINLSVSGLHPHTTYYFQVYQDGTSGLLSGGVKSFTTKGATATTNAASSITKTSATLNGNFVLNGDSYTIYYNFASDADLTTDTRTITVGSQRTDGSLTGPVSGLNSGTRYYFRICVKTNAADLVGDPETVCGAILNFVTASDPAPAPATPPVDIKWPNPDPLNYPTPLGGGQLNANATCNGQPVTGTYTYSPVLGTILDPGTYTLTVTFVPDAASGCRSAMTTVTIVVKAQAPTITWPTPEKELGPVTLGPKELNATCSVPGKLTYDPAAGTVLQPGTYTLKVTCTPTDPKLPPVSTTVILIVEAPLGTPQNGKTGPNTFTNGYIKWDPVANASNYSVEIRGEVVCTTTSETTCTVDRTIGPKTPVIVNAFGKYNQKTSAKAVYYNNKLLPAIVVNFATGSAVIDAKGLREVARVSAIVKLEGFTYVVITGHTDPRGGAINVALSKRRANSLKAAMLKLNSGLSFRDAGLAFNDPKATNKTASGMAMNRRSEGAVR